MSGKADMADSRSANELREIIAADKNTSGDLPKYLISISAGTTGAPERRRIVKITGEPGNLQTEVVSDYNDIEKLSDEIRQYSDTQAGLKQTGKPTDEMADSDDSPDSQQYLMQAWQAMALYLSSCDDEDKAGALQALKTISNLMSDNDDPNQPLPTGAFGTTALARADKAAKSAVKKAANTFTCPQCKRDFSTEQGLINHLKTVHAAREKETKMRTESD